jgi:hypothetical protein
MSGGFICGRKEFPEIVRPVPIAGQKRIEEESMEEAGS